MAATTTYLNHRESCVPYQDTDQNGDPAFLRKYQATIQYLVEGDTRSVLQYLGSISIPLGTASAGFNEFASVTIDDQNSFILATDLNYPSSIKDDLVFTFSEIVGNYDKSQYGKMTATVQLDISGPKEFLSLSTGDWEKAAPVEY